MQIEATPRRSGILRELLKGTPLRFKKGSESRFEVVGLTLALLFASLDHSPEFNLHCRECHK
jgi:hypothetical protein